MYGEASYTRPILDRALSGPAFAVDELACAAGAEVLRGLVQARSPLDGSVIESQFMFRLCLSAICHQINWDFLSSRLARAFSVENIRAEKLSTLTARDVQRWLDGYHRPERIRAGERALLLRDIGNVALEKYGGDAERILSECKEHLYGALGLIERLDHFTAFREDPLRKKSNVLVHDIVRDGLAHFMDEEKIVPAIDYHIVRLYLRSGRVVPLHRSTLELFKNDSVPRPRLVKLLREAVSSALSLTALYAKLSVPEVNGIEWQIGRDICERDMPRCGGPMKQELPPFLSPSGKCPNLSYCRAICDSDWRKLREPDLKKRFY
jgi:hypothetical protein